MGYALIHHPSNSCESSISDNLTLQLQNNTPNVPILGIFFCLPSPPIAHLLPPSQQHSQHAVLQPPGVMSCLPSLRNTSTFGLAGGAWELWDRSPALKGPTGLRLTTSESSIQERALKTAPMALRFIPSHPNTPYLFDDIPHN